MLFDLSPGPTGVPDVDQCAPSGQRDGWVYAPCDAVELQQPAGCREPVTRKLWSRGQQVPATAYEAWRRQQPNGGPEPLDAGTVVGEADARATPRVG